MVDEQVRAIRESAALTWSEHVACLRVEGSDAFEVIDRLSTSDLHLRDGQILSTLFLDRSGIPIADLHLARDDEDFILLAEGISGSELRDHILAHAPEGAHHEVVDLSESHTILSLNGPYSWEVLAGVAGPEAVGLPYLTFFQLGEVLCFRTGKTGEYGYDLLIPTEEREGIGTLFDDVGAPFDLTWAGLEALDLCALENWFFNIRGEGQFGLSPLELQLQWRVSTNKTFVGSASLADRRKRGIESRLTFIQSLAPLESGDRVFHLQEDLGPVLHASHSPTRGDYVGLALLPIEYASSGLNCFQAVSGNRRSDVNTISPPAIHNRSLFVSAQLHSYHTRHQFQFPPVAPVSDG